ncbi:hypothetical protein JNW88_17865 [Micromonospora sp. ATA32]|nr:hypothetical protein [Micromonospora sp. ATA32]
MTGHEPGDGRIDWVQICLLGPLEVRADSAGPRPGPRRRIRRTRRWWRSWWWVSALDALRVARAARAAVGDPEFAEAYAGGRDTRLGTVRELLRITLGV